MEYTFETDESNKIITVRFTGEMHMDRAASFGADVRLRAKGDRFRLLCDFRMARSYITVIEAYYWIEQYYDSIDPQLKWVPTAHLTNNEDEDFFRFVETTFINRGANIRLFKDEKAAVCWLVSQPVQ